MFQRILTLPELLKKKSFFLFGPRGTGKSTKSVHDSHLKGLRALREEGVVENFAVVSRDRHQRKISDGIVVFPWDGFLDKLWSGEII